MDTQLGAPLPIHFLTKMKSQRPFLFSLCAGPCPNLPGWRREHQEQCSWCGTTEARNIAHQGADPGTLERPIIHRFCCSSLSKEHKATALLTENPRLGCFPLSEALGEHPSLLLSSSVHSLLSTFPICAYVKTPGITFSFLLKKIHIYFNFFTDMPIIVFSYAF